MKQRNSFVSNSSSTSYVIAFKCNEKCKCCGRSDSDLSDILERIDAYEYDDRTKLQAKGKDNVINFINDEWGDWSYVNHAVTIQKIESFLEKNTDWNVIVCQVSYHDEFINNMINEKDANKTLVKLWKENE